MSINNKTYDIIIPLGPGDVGFLPRVVDFVLRCFNNDVNKIYVLTANKNILKLGGRLMKYEKCQTIDEDTLLPGLSYDRVRRLLEEHAPDRVNRTGWYFQQFLKMGFSRSSFCDKYYLSWDSDTLPLAPIRFFEGDCILYNPKPEYNPNYFVTIKRLLGLEKLSDKSFISESMMFSQCIMNDLISEIEKSNVSGDDWIEKIIIAGDYTNSLPTFSEFETYGNFCMSKYPGVYKPRHLNTFREAGYIAGRNISEKILREISFDVDVVSFEMFHEPAFPNNLPHIMLKTRRMIKKVRELGIYGFIAWFLKRKEKVQIATSKTNKLSAIKYRLPDRLGDAS